MFDYLVVGAGLFGAVFAHEAIKRGKRKNLPLPPVHPIHPIHPISPINPINPIIPIIPINTKPL